MLEHEAFRVWQDEFGKYELELEIYQKKTKR